MNTRVMSGAVALLMSVSVAMAQDVTAPNAAGAKAIMFSFVGLADLAADPINGGIGGKYFITAPLALRASVQFGTATETTPVTPPAVLPAGWTSKDGKASQTTVGFSCGAEYHFLASRVSPYAGAEVLYSTTWTEERPAVGGISPLTQGWIKNEIGGAANSTMGFYGIAGIEFFMTKEISLSGEYQLGYYTTWYPDEKSNSGATGSSTITTPSDEPKPSGIGIGTAALTLSVYF
jgi:hypothetical protein